MNFEYTKPIRGTINDGTAGVVTLDGEIIADFIELKPGLFYAEPVNDVGYVIGSKAEVIVLLATEVTQCD
jgi:hypothetical protein